MVAGVEGALVRVSVVMLVPTLTDKWLLADKSTVVVAAATIAVDEADI